jgi:Tfp pilus assembly protein PilF
MNLYTDDNPEFTVKDVGFKDSKTARNTIKNAIKAHPRDKISQMRIIHAMYYRARCHPNKTKEMREAMKILKDWLDNYKK